MLSSAYSYEYEYMRVCRSHLTLFSPSPLFTFLCQSPESSMRQSHQLSRGGVQPPSRTGWSRVLRGPTTKTAVRSVKREPTMLIRKAGHGMNLPTSNVPYYLLTLLYNRSLKQVLKRSRSSA